MRNTQSARSPTSPVAHDLSSVLRGAVISGDDNEPHHHDYGMSSENAKEVRRAHRVLRAWRQTVLLLTLPLVAAVYFGVAYFTVVEDTFTYRTYGDGLELAVEGCDVHIESASGDRVGTARVSYWRFVPSPVSVRFVRDDPYDSTVVTRAVAVNSVCKGLPLDDCERRCLFVVYVADQADYQG